MTISRDAHQLDELAGIEPPVAIAFSGGADSTFLLLAAAKRWPGRVVAIHVHHGLQAAADDFVRHCQAVCDSQAIALHVVYVNAKHASGQSPQDAARQARYAALTSQAVACGVRSVLVGQHADDQLETMLLALSRGAGVPGLAAMAPRFEREGVTFFRPLLQQSAADIRQNLLAIGQSFLDDPSNANQHYTRNHIRLRLLPVLREVFPQCLATFARSAQHAAQAQTLLCELAQDDLRVVGTPPNIARLQSLSRVRQANVLRYWLGQCHQTCPSAAQLEQLLHQIAACITRAHRIELRVAAGHIRRKGAILCYLSACQ